MKSLRQDYSWKHILFNFVYFTYKSLKQKTAQSIYFQIITVLHRLAKWERFTSLCFLLLSCWNSSPKHPPPKTVPAKAASGAQGAQAEAEILLQHTQNLLPGSAAVVFATVCKRSEAAREKQWFGEGSSIWLCRSLIWTLPALQFPEAMPCCRGWHSYRE